MIFSLLPRHESLCGSLNADPELFHIIPHAFSKSKHLFHFFRIFFYKIFLPFLPMDGRLSTLLFSPSIDTGRKNDKVNRTINRS